MQTKHFYAVKENLSPGEVLAVGDFSEISLLWFKMLLKVFIGLTPLAPFTPGSVITTRRVSSRH